MKKNQIIIAIIFVLAVLFTASSALAAININEPFNLHAYEEKSFSHTISASDTENPDAILKGKYENLQIWLENNPPESLILTGTPLSGDVGKTTFEVTALNEITGEFSEPQEYNLTVHPALEVLDNSLSITINEIVKELGENPINFTPGDEITVNFKVKNNLDSLMANIVLESTPSQLTDDYYDYYWALSAGEEVQAEEINFIADTLGDFTLKISASGGLFEDYLSEKEIDFQVIQLEQDLMITNLEIEDQNLTCTRVTELIIDVKNSGTENIIPEFYVANKLATSVGLGAGELEFDWENNIDPDFLFSYTGDDELTIGEEGVIGIPLNVKELGLGEHTIYVYAVSPYIEGFVSDYEEIKVNIKDECFNVTALEENFQTHKGVEFEQVTIDLVDYLIEDHPELYQFDLEVVDNINPELSDCDFDSDTGEFYCNVMNLNDYGNTELTLKLTELNKMLEEVDDNEDSEKVYSELEDKFTITVFPTIEFEDVKISSGIKEITKAGETLKISPFDTLNIEFKLKNELTEKIHGVDVWSESNDILKLNETHYLAKLDSKDITDTITLTELIPFNVEPGTYIVDLMVEGIYAGDDLSKEDLFTFNLEVSPNYEEGVNLQGVEIKDEAMNNLYCDETIVANIEFVNGGNFDEDDIVIEIKTQDETVLYNSYDETGSYLNIGTITPNDHKEVIATFNTFELPIGEHTITVELSYNSGTDINVYTFKVNKNGCLNIPAVNLTMSEDDDENGILLDLNDYLVNEDETVAFTDNTPGGSKTELVYCDVSVEGYLTCKDIKALAQEMKPGQSNTTELNVTLSSGYTTDREEIFTITLTGANDAPIIEDSQFNFKENSTYEVDTSYVASDVDNELSELSFSEDSEHIASITNVEGKFIITPTDNSWNTEDEPTGVYSFNLTVSDSINQTTKLAYIKISNDDIDVASIKNSYPAETSLTYLGSTDHPLNVTINNPDNMDVKVKWDVKESGQELWTVALMQGNTYIFNKEVGTYDVKASLVNEVNNEEIDSVSWTITVINNPKAEKMSTNIPPQVTQQQLKLFSEFTAENSHGKIRFNQDTDLSGIVDLDEVMSISNGLITIDSSKVPGLNKPATVTLYNTGILKPIVKKYQWFTTDKADIKTKTTIQAELVGSNIVFNVSGFSTYAVFETVPAELTVPAEINIESINRSETINVNFTVENTGTVDTITNLQAELINVNSKYAASVSLANSLAAESSTTGTLIITTPEDESSGKHKIGEIKISGSHSNGTLEKTISVYLNPKSMLEIVDIEINGDNDGELVLDEDNEITIEIRNNYQEDMDVSVNVEIQDVDGDDLDEDADDQTIDAGEKETFDITFDLSNENVDEDKYIVVITIEGDADDNSDHEIVEEIEISVDRVKHKLIIEDVSLTPNMVKCDRQAAIGVDVKNVGTKNQDDVEVNIYNSQLGIDETKTISDLKKYSSSSNNDNVKFYLNDFIVDADAGTYKIDIEVVYDNGDEKETDSVSLEINNCEYVQQTEDQQNTYAEDDLTLQTQLALQQSLQAKSQQSDVVKVKSSFREGEFYLGLLAILLVLVLFAGILLLAIMFKKGNSKKVMREVKE